MRIPIQRGVRAADDPGMLLCKACNTRFGDGKSACPSCGRRSFVYVNDGPSGTTGEVAKLAPVPEAETTETDLHDDPKTDVDLELAEEDLLVGAVEPEAADELKPEPPPAPARRRTAHVESEPARAPKTASSADAPARRGPPAEPGPAGFHPSAAQVRTLVAEQPGLLQSDLSLYRDANKGLVGVDLRTPVGSIDVLARDAAGDFVVVMIPDARDVDNLMPEMLARIGWVRKHLASKTRSVRGLVVIEEIPEELAYAAAGVGGTISFHAYRVALSFHPLDL